MSTPAATQEQTVLCPFTILVDSNELTGNHKGYTFESMRTNADRGNKLIRVRCVPQKLPVGDYTVAPDPKMFTGRFPHSGMVIERKSLADLYGSVADRGNFEKRLAMMARDYLWAGVVVEAEVGEVLRGCPPSQLSPKSLWRSINAWSMRYLTVHWYFMPGRDAAEKQTFRLLERWWLDRTEGKEYHSFAGVGKGNQASYENEM